MDDIKSNRKKALILTAVAIVLLVVGALMLSKPISYGLNYDHASMYESVDFKGSLIFYQDNTMLVRNTNFNEELKSYYYYKDGYIFFTIAETEEEYREEVAAIDNDFEGAVNSPFYASKINAFSIISVGVDGYKSVYNCEPVIMIAIIGAFIELSLVVTAVSFWKKVIKK